MRTGIARAGVLAAWLAAGCAGALAQAPGISDGTVKIGVLTDMAGVFSDLAGASAVTAAQMAIDDFVEKKAGLQDRAGVGRSPEQARHCDRHRAAMV